VDDYDQRVDELPRPNPDVVFRDVEGETVLVHLGTNRIYALNATGARLWQLLTEGHDRPELMRRLLEEFDVEPATLAREIDGLLHELSQEELVA
jgi:hypothetical protein